MKRLAISALVAFAMCATLAAQNTINIPDAVPVGEKIVASCDCPVPTDGKLSILWDFSPELQTAQFGDDLCIWGKPRKEPYQVSAVIIPLKTVNVSGQTFDVIAGDIQRMSARFRITGPKPDPEPDPKPPVPDPKVDSPFPSDGFAVMVVKEASETGELPESQRAIFTSVPIMKYLTTNCVKVDGEAFFRFWDDDYTDSQLAGVADEFSAAYKATKGLAKGKLPWICISTGSGGFSGPLPGSVDETLALLKKHGE